MIKIENQIEKILSFFLSKWPYIIFFIVLVAIGIIFFLNRETGWFSNGYVIDNALWGNLGDFIGGIFGPILALLSALLIACTFIGQRDFESKLQKNADLDTRRQRLNSMFFSLIDLYNKQVNTLETFIGSDFYASTPPPRLFGKDFFAEYMKWMLKDQPSDKSKYKSRQKDAVEKYLEIYQRHATSLASYFRTVYRICEEIEQAEIPNEEKASYVKILRSQMSIGEIFFLRYNALTPLGEQSQHYINLFRLTKHLYVLDLMEFYPIRKLFKNDINAINTTNILLHRIWKTIYDLNTAQITDEQAKRELSFSTKYMIEAVFPTEDSFKFAFVILNDKRNVSPYLQGVKNLSNSDLELLIKLFIKEIFFFSSFDRYNNKDNTEFSRPTTTTTPTETRISCSVRGREGHKLRLRHPNWDK